MREATVTTGSKRALVCTQADEIPAAIKACRDIDQVVVSPESFGGEALQELISKHRPDVIFIDGEYGAGDHDREHQLSAMSLTDIRLALGAGRDVPLALKLLAAFRDQAGPHFPIVFFIDQPSAAFTQVLARQADVVWPALTFESNTEKALPGLLRRRFRWSR